MKRLLGNPCTAVGLLIALLEFIYITFEGTKVLLTTRTPASWDGRPLRVLRSPASQPKADLRYILGALPLDQIALTEIGAQCDSRASVSLGNILIAARWIGRPGQSIGNFRRAFFQIGNRSWSCVRKFCAESGGAWGNDGLCGIKCERRARGHSISLSLSALHEVLGEIGLVSK